LDTLKAM